MSDRPVIEGVSEELVAAIMPETATFSRHAGLVLDLVSPTRAEAHLDVQPHHHQPYGSVHGGVYTTIVESLASVGATANVAERGVGVVGVSNHTDFLRATRDGRLTAVATPIHQGRTQQLWLVEITRADGKLAARGQVRLHVVVPDER